MHRGSNRKQLYDLEIDETLYKRTSSLNSATSSSKHNLLSNVLWIDNYDNDVDGLGMNQHLSSETELNAGIALAQGRGFDRRADMFKQ